MVVKLAKEYVKKLKKFVYNKYFTQHNQQRDVYYF